MKVTKCGQLPKDKLPDCIRNLPDAENKNLDGTPAKKNCVQIAQEMAFRRQYGKAPK
jgi:hypothetical protein